MVPPARIAPAAIRRMILECLRDPERRFIHRDNFRFLHSVDLRDDDLVADLIADLEIYELFLKPDTHPQKYQFVMRYDEDALLIHITLSPDSSNPPRVKIAVHRHNIPGSPLPLILVPPEP